ncbi:FERM domain-containing protein 7-like [Brienomyrus brachyistius]|uniref:FERM domain-containing protein 7-like n=1 Tax=Brienomyrus brachyistius TaxID=42636 RepID=UPI0020B3863E|nr:FERM domain-containing protein 7-like [Brienomyrus brachyistius]
MCVLCGFRQLYDQAHTYPCSSQALKLGSQDGGPQILGDLRSKSAMEVVIAAELERSRLCAPEQVAFRHPCSASSDREVAPERRSQGGRRLKSMEMSRAHSLTGTQQLVLLYPNDSHLRLHPVLPTFPLAAQACTPAKTRTTCPAPRLSLLDDVTRSSTFSAAASLSPRLRQRLRQSRLGALGDRGGGVYGGSLGFSSVETGHYSDDSSYQASLPQRAWSQADVKLQDPTATCRASEFRPLGHYAHLSRRQSPARPTYLPLGPSPLSERPASLCVLGAGSFSDSDSESVYPYYCSTLGMLLSTAPLACMRLSSGSLQLDEEDEGGDPFKLTDNDGAKA